MPMGMSAGPKAARAPVRRLTFSLDFLLDSPSPSTSALALAMPGPLSFLATMVISTTLLIGRASPFFNQQPTNEFSILSEKLTRQTTEPLAIPQNEPGLC